jgi:hypothetical protein
MLLAAYIRWWYGPGWRDSAGRLQARLTKTYFTVSVPILLTTMYAPWRRIVSAGGGSLGDRFRAGVDNVVSRGVGFGVRLMALGAACFIMLVTALVGGVILLLWPVIPLLGPALVVGGLL